MADPIIGAALLPLLVSPDSLNGVCNEDIQIYCFRTSLCRFWFKKNGFGSVILLRPGMG